MAIKQTRRSVSVSQQSYAALQKLATARGKSMAAVVDQLISDEASAKPEAVANAAAVGAGGGPVQWAFGRLADRLALAAEEVFMTARQAPSDANVQIATAIADSWFDLAAMIREAAP